MINYGLLLKKKEKDNPSPFCRASYLISNAGEAIKLYGRMIRFPNDAKLYKADMKLAIADVIMQCRLIETKWLKERQDLQELKNHPYLTTIEDTLLHLLESVTTLSYEITEEQPDKEDIKYGTWLVMQDIVDVCTLMEWDVNEIEHLGFVHVTERYEQFERRGWQ